LAKDGGIHLARAEKKRHCAELSRREFLKYTQGATLAFLPSKLTWPFSPFRNLSPALTPSDFRVHPQYRTPRALDAVLRKVAAENDSFPCEIYHDRIAAILQAWSKELQSSPQNAETLMRVTSDNFAATSPAGSLRALRMNDSPLQVWATEFREHEALGREAFLSEWRSAVRVFSKMLTAEFQITNIKDDTSPIAAATNEIVVRTRVHYEFVGTGSGFHREHWVGNLDLDWKLMAGSEIRLNKWRNIEETRSRSVLPIFEDRAEEVFGGCESYASQFLFGVDYWRTLLDGASGIDVYGHNGVAVGDIDGDGFDDLYICQPAGLPNRLYRNRGDGTFEDVTEKSGVGILNNTACALFADIDNDGRQDLIVVRASGPLLFLNQGNGQFRRRPNAFQFANPPRGTFTGAAIADYDRDGWLDIYFCLYLYYQGTDQYQYPMPYYAAENGPPNFLMKNGRDGSFHDVTKECGLDQNNTRFSFCCAWADPNGDGWPDLYVANDFGKKNFYRNRGDGTFTDIAEEAGVQDVGAGMSVTWLDYDNDGRQDLYVADMWTAAGLRVSTQEEFQKDASEEARKLYRRHAMGNCLYRNLGEDKFADVGSDSGTQFGRWAWSSDAWDMDHDGRPDLYIANGMISGPLREDLNSFFWRQVVANSPESANPRTAYEQGWTAVNELIRADSTWSGYERNVLYVNNGDGTFSDVSGAAGVDFLEDSRTFALADFDHDGRVEMVLKNRTAPQLRFLKNVMPQLPAAIAFRLTGNKSNRDAIGAVVTILTAAGKQQRFVQAGSGFLAQHSKELFFGLGQTKGNINATIRWPSGLVQRLEDLPTNHRIWVEEGSPAVRTEAFLSRPNRAGAKSPSSDRIVEQFPAQAETWLLVPIAAPDLPLGNESGKGETLLGLRGKPLLLYFGSANLPDWQNQLKELEHLYDARTKIELQLVVVNVNEPPKVGDTQPANAARWPFSIVNASADTIAVYNLLYGRLFDRHRDMGLPTAFLLDPQGEICKVYQGGVPVKHIREDVRRIPKTLEERTARGLPFPGVAEPYEFDRNYLSLGSVFYEYGYLGQAETYFQLAEKEDPDGADALYGLGSVYLHQQRNKEAREYLQRAVQAHANYPGMMPNAWNNLGIVAAREGNADEAIKYFLKALELNPEHVVALGNLGSVYRQKKDWENARIVLERALRVDPDNAEINFTMGMVYAQCNDLERAHDYLQKAVAVRPAFPEALDSLGLVYFLTGRPDEAKRSLAESIRVAPSYAQSYLDLAKVYAVQGDKAKAREVLEQLLKIHPDQEQAQKDLRDLSE
jgi:tetratricopeptide (TPR) repeat protein